MTQCSLARLPGIDSTLYEYIGGLTNTGAAMEIVTNDVIGQAGDRPTCPNICLVITDGATNDFNNNTQFFNQQIGPFKEACDQYGNIFFFNVTAIVNCACTELQTPKLIRVR